MEKVNKSENCNNGIFGQIIDIDDASSMFFGQTTIRVNGFEGFHDLGWTTDNRLLVPKKMILCLPV